MRGKKDGAISKIGDCGVGSSWWTVWVEILGSESVKVCWGWAHWESKGTCVGS